MLVRIYPREPKRGYHAARFQLRGSGYPIFKVERGWYEVDAAMAKKLGTYHNRGNDAGAKPIFQICTRAEAIAVEEAEREALRRADATTPIPLPKALAEVDWDKDMGSEPEEGIKTKGSKFVPMSELDVDTNEEDEDESDIEDPPEVDLLDELDDEAEEEEPKVTKKAKKKTKKTKKKAKARRKAKV